MIRILLVHGIGVSRSLGWSAGWQNSIRKIMATMNRIPSFAETNWEVVHRTTDSESLDQAESRDLVRARGTHYLADLLEDLPAIQSEQVEVYMIDQIASIREKASPTDSVWIIAHSLGTAIVYKALEHMVARKNDIRVNRLITIGSPLWLSHSWMRYISSMSMPTTRNLPNVGLWQNIAGVFDPIAGRGLWGRPRGCDIHVRCWASHQMESYIKTGEFKNAFII